MRKQDAASRGQQDKINRSAIASGKSRTFIFLGEEDWIVIIWSQVGVLALTFERMHPNSYTRPLGQQRVWSWLQVPHLDDMIHGRRPNADKNPWKHVDLSVILRPVSQSVKCQRVWTIYMWYFWSAGLANPLVELLLILATISPIQHRMSVESNHSTPSF